MQQNNIQLANGANSSSLVDGYSFKKYSISQGPRIFSSIPNTTQAYQRQHMKNEIVADSYDIHDSFIHKEEQKNSEVTTLLQDTETDNSRNSSSFKLSSIHNKTVLIKGNSTTESQPNSCQVANSYSIHGEAKEEAFYNMFREKDDEIVWKLSLLSERRKFTYVPCSSVSQRNGKRKKWYNESDFSDMEIDDDSDLYRTIRESFRIVKDSKKNGRLRSQNLSASNHLQTTRGNNSFHKKKAKSDKRSYQQQQNNELSFVSGGVWFWDTKCRQAVAICLDKETLTRDISEIFKSSS